MWLAKPVFAGLSAWMERAIAARRPKGHSILLNQKRIYILPTAAGWGFFALCVLLFFIATNYQNNLIHAVAYLLVAMGVLTIHYTYLNLSGLRITAVKAKNCFAGDLTELIVKLESKHKRAYDSIKLNWQEQPSETTFVETKQSKEVSLTYKSIKRGRVTPGPLKIETTYPFGLLRAWSWIELDLELLVYPKPIKGTKPDFDSGDIESDAGESRSGDDFFGLEEFSAGQSTRHIAWKQYAQGRGLLVKRFAGHQSRQIWLDWEAWPELALEKRLSVICYWALQLEHEGIEYGLLLPGVKLVPALGPEHLDKVLVALSLLGENSDG